MTAQARKQRQQAAGTMLAQAADLEREARRTIPVHEAHRLNGRALILRGSAWLLEAEAMDGEA